VKGSSHPDTENKLLKLLFPIVLVYRVPWGWRSPVRIDSVTRPVVIDPQSGAILRVVVILLLSVRARLLNLPLRFLQVGLVNPRVVQRSACAPSYCVCG